MLGEPVQALAGRLAAPKASPSAAEKDRNTPIPVPVTGSSQAACPGAGLPAAGPGRLPVPRRQQGLRVLGGGTLRGRLLGLAHHVLDLVVPDPGPRHHAGRVAVPSRLIATTVSWRERDTPFVVSVFPAQRRFADEVSSAITTQSSHRAAASARSTVSCGLMPCWFPAGAVMFPPPRC